MGVYNKCEGILPGLWGSSLNKIIFTLPWNQNR
jgi:hypothetical protein